MFSMQIDKLFKLPERVRFPEDIEWKEGPTMYSLRARETFYLHELQPGMVLAEPVLDRSGNRLLNSDIALDESKIEKLRARGVSRVRVKREEKTVSH